MPVSRILGATLSKLLRVPQSALPSTRETASFTAHASFGALVAYTAFDHYKTHYTESLTIKGNSMYPTLHGSDLPSLNNTSSPSQPLQETKASPSNELINYVAYIWASITTSSKPRRDRVLVTKRLFPSAEARRKDKDARWEARRGSIVSFASPKGPAPVGFWNSSSTAVVKRVVAVEGDIVVPLRRKVVRVDGDVVGDQDASSSSPSMKLRDIQTVYDADGHTYPPTISPSSPMPLHNQPEEPPPTPITIPFAHVWVEGDATASGKSIDSNDYGPISKSLIQGEVYGIWKSWRTVERPDWEGDGWEERMGGRLRRRKKTSREGGEGYMGVPEEWAIH